MNDIYFNAVAPDENEKSGFKFVFPPLHYNKKTKELNRVKSSLCNAFDSDAVECAVLDKGIHIMHFVMRFPGRKVRNIKVALDDKIAVFSSECSYFENQGWYGVTITIADKDKFPITREIELSKEVYRDISRFTEKKITEQKTLEDITDSILVYTADCRTKRTRKSAYKLEEVVKHPKGAETKWDFFLMHERGIPLTGIHRYSYGNFEELDMCREVQIPAYTDKLSAIHNLNCSALSACNSTCLYFGSSLNYKDTSLRHISTQLHNDKGVGFTMIDRTEVDNEGVMFVLDVKNKLRKNGRYINRLFGCERQTLDLIRKTMTESGLISRILKETENGGRNCDKSTFNIFRQIVEEQKKTVKDFI